MSMINTCAVKPPLHAYNMLADKGADTTKYSSFLVFAQSFYAGCYIGFGALLATKISASMPEATENNPGLQSFVFAALFPVNLLLILLTGGILFTGTSAACPAAVYEGKIKIKDAARCLGLSWWGNVLGSLLFAYFTKYCQLLEGATASSAILISQKKISKDFGTTFLKGIGCNWMVCMAVFLCGQAQDMCGKYLGIWFPISTFVMIGFEHIPANFYLMELGLLADGSDITFWDVLVKNWIPVTLGNFVAGAFIVAGGYSFMFGRLGSLAAERFQPKKDVDEEAPEVSDRSGSKKQPELPELKEVDTDDADKMKSDASAEKSESRAPSKTSLHSCVSKGEFNGI